MQAEIAKRFRKRSEEKNTHNKLELKLLEAGEEFSQTWMKFMRNCRERIAGQKK
jgi:hypothetical protein